MKVEEISVSLIDPPSVTMRKSDLSILEEIKASVKQQDFVQPIMVRPKGARFQLIFGNHRLEVAKNLGLKTIPAIIRNMDDDEAGLTSIIENSQRNAHLDPVAEGEFFSDLEKKGWTVLQIAKKLGKSDHYVNKRLRIYCDLHGKLLNRVSHRKMPVDLAFAISQHPLTEQLEAAKQFQERRKALSQTPLHDFRCLQCPLHCPKGMK